jgi:hypothetical protein
MVIVPANPPPSMNPWQLLLGKEKVRVPLADLTETAGPPAGGGEAVQPWIPSFMVTLVGPPDPLVVSAVPMSILVVMEVHDRV